MGGPMNEPKKREGIEFINAYLECLLLERKFCTYFDKSEIILFHKKYTYDYKQQLVNLCEPVFANAVGAVIAGKSFNNLQLGKADKLRLRLILRSADETQVRQLIYNAADSICTSMKFGLAGKAYFAEAAEELADRVCLLRFRVGIDNVFI
jgi:hypothetical protein